ncbi:MAG: hypothetical protein K6B15_10340 [Parasporobacterium sp.]|nr:hypothetical protein [Parasporobacterium sp.]
MGKVKTKQNTGKNVNPYDPDKNLRNCTIVTQFYNPVDPSEKYITEDIQKVIDEHMDQIEAYAWIVHDKDTVLKEDLANYQTALERKKESDPSNPLIKYYEDKLNAGIGGDKTIHVHILIRWVNAKPRKSIAKWFGIKNMTAIKGSILETSGMHLNGNAVIYLLHVNAPDKYQYAESEVNCDPQTRMDIPRAIEKFKVKEELKSSKKIDEILSEMSKGKTMSEVYKDPTVAKPLYFKHLKLLRDTETEYRLREGKVADYLLNIYVQGDTGTGKSSLAWALANYMYPDEEDPCFTAGGKNVVFQNYMGQKVILWDDVTADKLLSVAASGDIQNLLDPYQQRKMARNIKNSSVILLNEINIFTSTIDYKKFFADLLPDRTDVNQIYRRIPVVIEVQHDDIYMLINNRVWNKTDEKIEWNNFDVIKQTGWKNYDDVHIAKINVKDIMQNVPQSMQPKVMEGVLAKIKRILQKLVDRETKKYMTDAITTYEIASKIELDYAENKYISKRENETIKTTNDNNMQILKDEALYEQHEIDVAEAYAYGPETPDN